ncbi:creatininase family protein [Roseomonas sp. BN140053]|uniref:creatininase family protein n=1 Tax=Roseomonas sp. BN140053 TaxID=3391898 RepID=UPI0039EBAC4C
MRSIRLEQLNTRAFREAGFTAAIVPIGACESHGDHMPFGTDALTAHALALRVAERLDSTVVLPALPFGMSEHYRHQPMCVSLSADTQIRVLRDVLLSLQRWGIGRVLILNGHDGNIAPAELAAREVKVAHPAMSLAVLDWWTVVPKFLPPETFAVWNGWGHAGEVESSVGLALFAELMNMAEARGMVPQVDEVVKEIWLFEELTAHGATGGPKAATAEKGGRVVAAVVDYLADYMARFERDGLRHDPREA